MDRLTFELGHIGSKEYEPKTVDMPINGYIACENELGRLEDLFEKYNVENIEELENALKKAKAFDIIKEYKVDSWLLENCDYENYIRIRKECLIENNKYTNENGKIIDDVIPENVFNKLKEMIK